MKAEKMKKEDIIKKLRENHYYVVSACNQIVCAEGILLGEIAYSEKQKYHEIILFQTKNANDKSGELEDLLVDNKIPYQHGD